MSQLIPEPVSSPYRRYIFNFRDDSMGPLPGSDAASWPDPGPYYDLDAVERFGTGAGVEAFIADELRARVARDDEAS